MNYIRCNDTPAVHEVSIVSDLIKAIMEELGRYDVSSVSAVTLVIGKLTNLGSDQMRFAYEVMTRGTILEGSELVIEEEEIALRCSGCGYEGPARNLSFGDDDQDHGIPILSCPECGGSVTVTAGRTCCVKNMDIEEVADVQIP